MSSAATPRIFANLFVLGRPAGGKSGAHPLVLRDRYARALGRLLGLYRKR